MKDSKIRKVLVIGSGPIVIGQAAEFDYAGAQACRVLRDEGINTVLVNSNPATIMTDKNLADEIYLEPLNAKTVERIIEKERPDGLLAGLGGQTGLTIAMQLTKNGVLKKYNVRLLGTDIDAIDKAEDRELFRDAMKAIGQPCVPSDIAEDVETALEIAEKIGYPIIVRPAFTLGGTGGGIADDPEELKIIAKTGLDMSPITQILVEKCISGWKEIEFETMRDADGNAVIVCSMENVDPVGIHTGDSIVAAPALTLNDREFGMLRQAALDIVTSIGIIGGCNCQFALKPDGSEYAVIEVNPRVSRSSALASKATGYPIAKITTKLALGYTLDEIRNEKTGASLKGFEPAVDYIVVKYPKFPFDKFAGSSRRLGTQMKATGEVMSIAPTFEAALMKAVRGAEIGLDTLNGKPLDSRPVEERLKDQDDKRLFTVFEAIKSGMSIDKIYDITKIDWYFLDKIKLLADYEAEIAGVGDKLSDEQYFRGKDLGYTDKAIRRISGASELPVFSFSYDIVRTCESVFGTERPYFYSHTGKICEARDFTRSGRPVIMVLGSGPIRIGQGIEFDYSSVHCVWMLRSLGYDVVTVNNNPETVSTDYDTSDRLYFEPLTPEDVMSIIEVEKPIGVVVAFGGQTAIKLTQFLDKNGITILGTSADGIDLAEDRARFDALLENIGMRRPKGMGVNTMEEAVKAAESLGYPVLLRPSYVIGGQNMTISRSEAQTVAYMEKILSGGIDNPVLIDKYMPGIELEVDVISDGTDVLIPGIMEHIERAGVHSGDSIAVYPPYNLNDTFLKKICECSEKLALSIGTKGLVNIQYLIYENELYVIEVNPRASRTVPYISKVTNVPMVDLAVHVMLGEKLADLGYGTGLYRTPPYFAVKVPVFSFEKLSDANSILGPEMKSTGEVLGIGKNTAEALFKGLTAAGFKLPSPTSKGSSGVVLSVEENDYEEIVPLARRFFDLGLAIYATTGTASAIRKAGIPVTSVPNGSAEIIRLLENNSVNYLIYTGAVKDATVGDYIVLHKRAMQLGIPCLTSLDTAGALAEIIESRYTQDNTELVDINNMRDRRTQVNFVKMHSCGNDYIFIDNSDGSITCPESLCVSLCAEHYGIGGDGIVLIEKSKLADAKMRSFNRDGSEGKMAGNNIRCVAKYLYDNSTVKKETMTIETVSGIHTLKVFLRDGLVTSVTVDMGDVSFEPSEIPVITDCDKVIGKHFTVAGGEYDITCVNVGNPHCVVFADELESLDLGEIGPKFEYAEIFPERINTEFVRVISPTCIRMRVWERGNGETLACGTGACAAVAAACENGLCERDKDITVKLSGGDMTVRYSDGRISLSGSAVTVFEGKVEI